MMNHGNGMGWFDGNAMWIAAVICVLVVVLLVVAIPRISARRNTNKQNQ